MTPTTPDDGSASQQASHVNGDRVDVVAAGEAPSCTRCGGEGLLSARVPHGFERPDGHRVNGTTVVVLCPRCDAGDRAAGALITFFHVHGEVESDTVQHCADLIHAWVDSIHIPPVNVEAVEAEFDAWKRGEL
ncbi:DUF6300 family protein [Actinomadura fulvescens]|uniref:DUF6300 family protein n=1 Tax=Actinomadura fulvescens TaxID=46160 RepID=A0ABP6CUJ6_9ACTN